MRRYGTRCITSRCICGSRSSFIPSSSALRAAAAARFFLRGRSPCSSVPADTGGHRAQDDDRPWRHLPECRHQQGHRSQPEILRRLDRARPHRSIEGRAQRPTDGRVHAEHRALHGRVPSRACPQRQRADHEQKGRQEDRNRRDRPAAARAAELQEDDEAVDGRRAISRHDDERLGTQLVLHRRRQRYRRYRWPMPTRSRTCSINARASASVFASMSGVRK